MARVRHMTQTYNNSIKRFLGVNESPTGDNALKNGEAVEMENYRVTLDGKLERRPAFYIEAYAMFSHVLDMWSGPLNGVDMIVTIVREPVYTEGVVTGAAIKAVVYTAGPGDDVSDIGDGGHNIVTTAEINICTAPKDDVKRCHMFGFQGKLYFLVQGGYYVWDGDLTVTQLPEVTPYVPLVVTASTPSGGGTELEGLNVLSDRYRVQFSPDGTSTEFYLPVTGNARCEWVKLRGKTLSDSYYSFDSGTNCITFDTAPAKGTNTMEVQMVYPQVTENLETRKVSFQSTSSSPWWEMVEGDLTDVSFSLTSHKVATGTDGESTRRVFQQVIEWTDKSFVKLSAGVLVYKGVGTPVVCTDSTASVSFNEDTGRVTVVIQHEVDADADTQEHIDTKYTYKFEFEYTAGAMGNATNAGIVTNMTRSVLFNGATDSRVFLYGDGTYTCIYSGIDENGTPRADYFPALNQANIGSSNTPVYGMVRHYNSLLAFKPDEAYRITYEAQTLSDSTVIAGFNIRPIHSAIGTVNYDQAVLVYNNPRTICHESVYEWRLSYYTSSSNRDERNAKRISDRVRKTLSKIDWKNCWCFDDETEYEYWVTDGETAIINNYANDTWYIYTGLPKATKAVRFNGSLYLGGPGGVHRLNKEWFRDYIASTSSLETVHFVCTWKGACFDASHDYLNKWVIDQYIGLLNQEDNAVTATIETDRKNDYPERTIVADEDAATPTMHHIKIRHKAWAFSRLKLTSVVDKFSTIVSIDTNYRLGTNGRRE